MQETDTYANFQQLNHIDQNFNLSIQQRKKLIEQYLTINTNHIFTINYDQQFKKQSKYIIEFIKQKNKCPEDIRISKRQIIFKDIQEYLKIQEKIIKLKEKILQSISSCDIEQLTSYSSLSYLQDKKNYTCIYQQKQKQKQKKEDIFQDFSNFRDQTLQFICSQEGCFKNPFLCLQQSCRCKIDHKLCKIIPLQRLINQLKQKLQKPILPQIYLYFQSKVILYEYMMNKISQQRQILRQWYEQIFTQSIKTLFLYGFNEQQIIVCYAPKILYAQKQNDDHRQCKCFPIKIRKKHIKAHQKDKINQIYSNVKKIFSSIISYLDTKIQNIEKDKNLINLNAAEMLIVKHLRNKAQNFEFQRQDTLFQQDKKDKKNQNINGHTVFLAREYKNSKENDKQLIKKFDIQIIRQKWQNKFMNLFTINIQGKSTNQLFCWMKKADYLLSKQVSSLKINLDSIETILNQDQEKFIDKIISCNESNRLKSLSESFTDDNYHFYVYQNKSILIEKINILTKESKLSKENYMQLLQEKHIFKRNNRQKKAFLEVNKFKIIKFMKTEQSNKLNGFQKRKAFSQQFQFEQQFNSNINTLLNQNKILKFYKFNPKSIQYLHINPNFNINYDSCFPNLKSLSIGLLQKQRIDQKKIQLTNEMIEIISQIKKLEEIKMINIKNAEMLIPVIRSNKNLKKIIAKKCTFNGYDLFEKLYSYCPNLNSLILQGHAISNLTRTYQIVRNFNISKFKQLKILVISAFPLIKINFDQQRIFQKLIHLDVSKTIIRNDIFEQLVMYCPNLQFLNILQTEINHQSIFYLNYLKQLKTLFCKIHSRQLIDICNRCKKIQKLCIQTPSYNLQLGQRRQLTNDDLVYINGEIKLTHLQLDGNSQIQYDDFRQMKNLEVIVMTKLPYKILLLSQKQIKQLQQNGVQVNILNS